MKPLAEAFVEQQEKLRICLQHGREIGPAGAFYCAIIEDLLRRADRAVMEQDLPTMAEVYSEMVKIKE